MNPISRSLYQERYYKKRENSRLRLIRKLSYYLDNSIGIPGTGYRIGLDAIIGLIPGLGDVAGGILSAYIVYEASRLGVPRRTLLHMTFNVAVETLIGAVPIVGDVFDAAWKANTKNIFLLDKYLHSPDGSAVLEADLRDKAAAFETQMLQGYSCSFPRD